MLQPGDEIQKAVTASPEGTSFLLKPGIYHQQHIKPKDGMSFVGEPGAVLDGGGRTEYAFMPTADFVTIRNLEIRNYATPLQMGAIRAGGHTREESRIGWLVEDVNVHSNAGGGIRIGHEMIVRDSKINSNGQIGIVGIGDDVLIENNEIAYNNTAKHNFGWEAGGTKFVKTRRLIVRNNHVHHNYGPGLWTDIDNIHTLYEGNLVEHNFSTGIFHEISYDAIIRNNVSRYNGLGLGESTYAYVYGAGILTDSSPNVEIYGNTVVDNLNGINGLQSNRGEGEYGPWELRNFYAYDNDIAMIYHPDRTGPQGEWGVPGISGIAQGGGMDFVFSASYNNRFEGNRYRVPSGTRHWTYANAERTFSAWQGYGMDSGGVVNLLGTVAAQR